MAIEDRIRPGTNTEVQMRNVKDWWDHTMKARNKDPGKACAVIVSRLHDDDRTEARNAAISI